MTVRTAAEAGVTFDLVTTAFCGACRRTRTVLDDAVRFIPGATVVEHPVESEPAFAERFDIDATPTVIVRTSGGEEILRAVGVPTTDQVLRAGVRALDRQADAAH